MKNKMLFHAVFATLILESASLFSPLFVRAANLTAAKNTLQSSRLSFFGRVKSPTIAGSSHVWIYTAADGNATSVSTAGLKPGDSLIIGGTNTYTIGTIIDDDEFTITTTLAAGDADDTDVIYFKAKPQHVLTFKTASAINGGFFRVLIPAAASGSNDTIPDITGFDFNSGVTATGTNTTGYTFVTGVATAAGATGCTSPANYHCFEFHYNGAGGVGTDVTLSLGATNGTNTMVAPAPASGHTAGTADTYMFKIQNFTNGADPNSDTPTDEVTGKVAVVESVRVTATVDPSISFTIAGTTAGSHCSLDTDVATTATAVPFGVLTLNAFLQAAQTLTVSTNAVSGYTVTAIENERLSNLASSPSYIANTTCDSGTCAYDGSGSGWATATGHPGFGYTVAIVNGTPTIAPTAPNFRPFGSLAATETPVTIMSNAGTADTQQVDVCYQISVDATQPAGNYENQITYTATASF